MSSLRILIYFFILLGGCVAWGQIPGTAGYVMVVIWFIICPILIAPIVLFVRRKKLHETRIDKTEA